MRARVFASGRNYAINLNLLPLPGVYRMNFNSAPTQTWIDDHTEEKKTPSMRPIEALSRNEGKKERERETDWIWMLVTFLNICTQA